MELKAEMNSGTSWIQKKSIVKINLKNTAKAN